MFAEILSEFPDLNSFAVPKEGFYAREVLLKPT